MSIPRTTHQWLRPLYDALDGHAKRPLQFGSPTSYFGVYGVSGAIQYVGVGSTGTAAGGGPTGSSFFDQRSNGGTGTNYYTLTDIVQALKGVGIIAK